MMHDSSTRQEFQFRDAIGILKRRKWILWGFLALGIAGGLARTATQEPLYRTTKRILVTTSLNTNTTANTIATDLQPLNSYTVEDHMNAVQATNVLQDAFRSANYQLPQSTEMASQIVSVRQVGNSDVLDVSVDLPDQAHSEAVAEALVQTYNTFLTTKQKSQFTSVVEAISTRLKLEQAALETARQKLTDFQRSRPPISIGREGEERSVRVSREEAQLQAAEANLAGSKEKLVVMRESRKRLPEYIDSPSVQSNLERIETQKRRLADLQTERAQLLEAYEPSSREVQRVDAAIAAEQRYTKQLPKMQSNELKIKNPEIPVYDQRVSESRGEVEYWQAQVDKLRGYAAEEKKGIQDYVKLQFEESKLQQEVASRAQSVQDLSKRHDDVVYRSGQKDPVTELASMVNGKVSPDPVRNLLVGIFLSLFVGGIVALLRDRSDDRVHTIDQIFDASGALPIGQVPSAEKVLALAPSSTRNATIESYRALRFSLERSIGNEAVQTVLITSATANEGRAPLAYNIAAEAALDMRRTILLDADMRRPTLHERLGVSRGPGLSELLVGTATFDEVVKATSNENLRVIPAGAEHSNPLELLSSPAMAELLKTLKTKADVVIVNSPSLLRYADGRAIAQIVDGVVFVAKRGTTRQDAMRYCIDMIRRTGGKLLGVVLNDGQGRPSDVPYSFSSEE